MNKGKEVEEYISSLETSEKTSLLASFRYYKGLSAKKDLVNVAFNLIRESDIIIHRSGDNLDKIQSPEGMWMKIDIINNDYKFLWIHRWICLFILNKLIPEDGPRRVQINDELKEFLAILIKYSGNQVPGYIKNLRYTDLSGADLSMLPFIVQIYLAPIYQMLPFIVQIYLAPIYQMLIFHKQI